MKAKKFNTETVKDHEILMLVPREMGMVKIWYDGDLTDFKTLNRWVKKVKDANQFVYFVIENANFCHILHK